MWRLSLPQLGVFMTVEALKCGKRGPREVWYIDILHPQGYTISERRLRILGTSTSVLGDNSKEHTCRPLYPR